MQSSDIIAKIRPGRFIMVWLPGIDEFPLSPSRYDHKSCSIEVTFKIRGEGTRALSLLNVGDKVFIRGPYGNGFKLPKTRQGYILLVGGGVGLAPLMPLIEELLSRKFKVKIIAGFRSSKAAFFLDRIGKMLDYQKCFIATDDGSLGLKGSAVDVALKVLKEARPSYAYACGPEAMLFNLHKLLLNYNIPHQMLIERYVKCAIGICGSCAINGLRVCKDGPVFTDKVLRTLRDFGFYRRSPSGTREALLIS